MPVCEYGVEHPEPEPVVIEEAPDTEPVAEASVEIARIEADRDVQTAKIYSKGQDEDTAATMAALQARIEVLETARAPVAEPEVVPVVIDAPPPEPEPEPAPAQEMPPAGEPDEGKPKKKNPWGW